MANMGYCKFRNVLKDMRDCWDIMDDELSVEEAKARKALIKLCIDIVADYGWEVDPDLEKDF